MKTEESDREAALTAARTLVDDLRLRVEGGDMLSITQLDDLIEITDAALKAAGK
jgi:hypothetical protein